VWWPLELSASRPRARHDRSHAHPIDRDEVRRLVAEEAAQVVEVLPAAEYEDEHIAGAISIPLEELDEQGPRLLERG
jgi:rhodanese-related sulfurtransferase